MYSWQMGARVVTRSNLFTAQVTNALVFWAMVGRCGFLAVFIWVFYAIANCYIFHRSLELNACMYRYAIFKHECCNIRLHSSSSHDKSRFQKRIRTRNKLHERVFHKIKMRWLRRFDYVVSNFIALFRINQKIPWSAPVWLKFFFCRFDDIN